jgi:hypothetical protein
MEKKNASENILKKQTEKPGGEYGNSPDMIVLPYEKSDINYRNIKSQVEIRTPQY